LTLPIWPLDEIHLGDALEYLRRLPSGSVDLVVSSPPYNVGRGKERRSELSKYMGTQDAVLKECNRVLRDTGSIFWQVGAYTDEGTNYPLDILFFPILEKMGMKPRNRVIWPRAHGVHASKRFSARHEAILWFTKTDNYKFFLDNVRVPQLYPHKKGFRGLNRGKITSNPAGKNPGDVWLYENVKHNHEEQTIHPAQFPESLVERITLAVTEPNDVILDPYMGSGTTAVVAKKLKRHFLGAEIDEEYWNVATRRLSGEPVNGRFVNLKQLREYALRNRISDMSRFSFDVQTSKTPSPKKTDLERTLQQKEFLWFVLSVIFGEKDNEDASLLNFIE
jgi:adenine-specific DNA-methyltransferase